MAHNKIFRVTCAKEAGNSRIPSHQLAVKKPCFDIVQAVTLGIT